MTVGIPRMPYLPGVAGLASMSSLAIVNLPSYVFATSSSTGANILQGPHHSAQKSTRTGFDDLRTSWSKVLSDTCLIISLMAFPGMRAAGGAAHGEKFTLSWEIGWSPVGARRNAAYPAFAIPRGKGLRQNVRHD